MWCVYTIMNVQVPLSNNDIRYYIALSVYIKLTHPCVLYTFWYTSEIVIFHWILYRLWHMKWDTILVCGMTLTRGTNRVERNLVMRKVLWAMICGGVLGNGLNVAKKIFRPITMSLPRRKDYHGAWKVRNLSYGLRYIN